MVMARIFSKFHRIASDSIIIPIKTKDTARILNTRVVLFGRMLFDQKTLGRKNLLIALTLRMTRNENDDVFMVYVG